jgi:hypothetical protein
VTSKVPVGSPTAVWYVVVTAPSVNALCGGPLNVPLGERISNVIASDG